MTNASRRIKTLILVRLDEVIVELERFKDFFFRKTFEIRLEELKELRTNIHATETVGEIADILVSEGLFYQLTSTLTPSNLLLSARKGEGKN